MHHVCVTAAGIVTAPAANAVTLTVPNYLHCSVLSYKCRQVNGTYDWRLPTACRWVWSEPAVPNRNISLCDYFV